MGVWHSSRYSYFLFKNAHESGKNFDPIKRTWKRNGSFSVFDTSVSGNVRHTLQLFIVTAYSSGIKKHVINAAMQVKFFVCMFYLMYVMYNGEIILNPRKWKSPQYKGNRFPSKCDTIKRNMSHMSAIFSLDF